MKHGLIINQRKANCSVYEVGSLIKDILAGEENEFSKEYTIDYLETDVSLVGLTWYHYDFYIMNWHVLTLPIPKTSLIKMKSKKIAIVVEVNPNDNLPCTPDIFDAYMVIDPTKQKVGKFFPMPRPIIQVPTKSLLDKEKFVLGGFGLQNIRFLTEKRFEELVQNANISGRDCIVRINLPYGTFTETSLRGITKYGDWLKSLAKSNVEVIVTHDYMNRNELIGWLSEHNINCFPYYRNRPGLSAVTDQAISAGRGIMITDCYTFRHLHKYIPHFPEQSYYRLSKSTLPGIKQMQEDWSPENFRKTFDEMLRELRVI